MKIIVCFKEVVDTALNLDFGLSNRVVFKEGLPHRPNPPDEAALVMALGLKSSGAEVTVVSIGEKRVESYLRNALAIGADKAVRIWDTLLTGQFPAQKALLISSLAKISGADLVITGSQSLDTANGQVGPLMASYLGWPCIGNVMSIESDIRQNNITLVKDIGRGEREKLSCSLPAVITVKSEDKLPYASLDKFIESNTTEVPVLNPTDLGISPEELKRYALSTRLTFPKPPVTKAPPLDSSLPAFYRILQLLQGGISKRKGRMLEGDAGQLAEQLYQLLLEDGVLKKK